MQLTFDLPSEQNLRARLDSVGIFNLITDDRFLETIEAQLPAHRERTYLPTETLTMFVAQILNDDSSCQRAVNDRIVRCLQHELRLPGTSTAAFVSEANQGASGGQPPSWISGHFFHYPTH